LAGTLLVFKASHFYEMPKLLVVHVHQSIASKIHLSEIYDEVRLELLNRLGLQYLNEVYTRDKFKEAFTLALGYEVAYIINFFENRDKKDIIRKHYGEEALKASSKFDFNENWVRDLLSTALDYSPASVCQIISESKGFKDVELWNG
jgi:hypothetical protein